MRDIFTRSIYQLSRAEAQWLLTVLRADAQGEVLNKNLTRVRFDLVSWKLINNGEWVTLYQIRKRAHAVYV